MDKVRGLLSGNADKVHAAIDKVQDAAKKAVDEESGPKT
jgi:hypothetical protein